ncbi:hypothetical protein LCGC14_2135100, partial [marine sediment metagenome]
KPKGKILFLDTRPCNVLRSKLRPTAFTKNELVDLAIKNLSYNGPQNQTVYITSHQYDEVENLTVNLTGYIHNGTYPNIKIYINNSLSNSLGSIFSGDSALDELNDSSTIKNITFTQLGTNIDYFSIPKQASVSSAFMNFSGFAITEGN